MATKTERSEVAIAGKSNHNTEYATSLFAFSRTLYRTAGGRFVFRYTGGAAMRIPRSHYVSRDEAIEWIATEATDPITGYGYTREQAERMADGIDAGKGYRDDD